MRRMKTDTPQKMAEHLLCKYMDHYERAVQSNKATPLSAVDRLSLEMALVWIAERYEVTPKWIEMKQRSQQTKVESNG